MLITVLRENIKEANKGTNKKDDVKPLKLNSIQEMLTKNKDEVLNNKTRKNATFTRLVRSVYA